MHEKKKLVKRLGKGRDAILIAVDALKSVTHFFRSELLIRYVNDYLDSINWAHNTARRFTTL